MKNITEFLINEAKTVSELKDKIAKLKIGQAIDMVYCIREKITEPHNSGAWMVDTSIRLEKQKSFPLRKEKYYFITELFTGGGYMLNKMYKSIGKKYSVDDFRQGFLLEDIYKMIDSFNENEIITHKGELDGVVFGHTFSETVAEEKCKELTKPYRVSSLKDKIKAVEQGIKDLEKMKAELKKLESEETK